MTHRPLGARRRRLVLEVPVDEPDGFGGRLRRYVAGPMLWGSLESLGSTAAPRGGRTDRPGLYRVGLRYRPGVTPAMRFADGPRRFAIRAADDPDGRRRDLVCEVEEVVEEASP
ncbi:head-tail adaptor protein [Methylorubrum extorquens]|uniref:head-tail adaptor protein n=1 Tax=Methylorubrum extorquens TaxID=408 RepID=UPI0009728BD2|nr:head-tail adaptor protein [Methylorubrum extorquens]APX87923.1 head-tail adaptor protein [Methylorubrum extorquens]MCG5248087.1 head-tail adaptor protein [Methylorubrum extorquens]